MTIYYCEHCCNLIDDQENSMQTQELCTNCHDITLEAIREDIEDGRKEEALSEQNA